jgi:DNA-binding response OmpR family regulator
MTRLSLTEMVERYLRLKSYEVRTSGDGETALEIAGEWSPDLAGEGEAENFPLPV